MKKSYPINNKMARRRKWILGGNLATKLLMLAACSYYTTRFLMDYFSYPTVMTMLKDGQEKAVFPNIILCNVNWIRKSYFCERATNDDAKALPWKLLESACPVMRRLCNRNSSYEFFPVNKSELACENTENDLFAKFMLLYDFYMFLSEEERTKASQKSSSFITSCLFNGVKCNHKNFTRIKTAMFGNNCFRTNFQMKSNSYGFFSGLRLMFNVDESEYLLSNEMFVGLGINAHISQSEDSVPKLNTDMFQVSSGRNTFVSMDQIYEKRLEEPYIDKCHKYNGDSRKSCLGDCWNRISEGKCNCTDPLANYPNYTDGVCDIKVRKQRCCLGHVRKNVLSEMINCECRQSCESVHYVLSQSSQILNRGVIKDRGAGLLRFYLRSSDIIKYESSPKYSGGQLGLWLGLSLMDLFGGFCNKIITNINTITTRGRRKSGKVKLGMLQAKSFRQ